MPEPADAAPAPRRGRLWVLLALGLALFALGVAIVEISTREGGPTEAEIAGASDAQRLFGGLPQAGERLGSGEAPVTIQLFTDVQCAPCREDFLGTVPPLVEDEVRAGEVKLLLRHYSVARNALEEGFFGVEAAAEQAYGWQYAYLFFRNQDEAERLGVGEELMTSLAEGIERLELAEWEETLEREGGPEGPLAERLEGHEELGSELGIRAGQAMVVSGPRGTRVLQEGPTLRQARAAIAAVR